MHIFAWQLLACRVACDYYEPVGARVHLQQT